MKNKFGRFLIRMLIFQFVFLFLFSKLQTPVKSIQDFTKRLKFVAKTNQFPSFVGQIIEHNGIIIFIIFYSVYSLSGILAIFGSKLGQRLAGTFTILISNIYCNPFSTIKKNFEKNKYHDGQIWKNYIPSLQFCLITGLGLIMFLISFYSFDDKKEDKNIDKKAEKKEKQN